jgi:hypothetical protein
MVGRKLFYFSIPDEVYAAVTQVRQIHFITEQDSAGEGASHVVFRNLPRFKHCLVSYLDYLIYPCSTFFHCAVLQNIKLRGCFLGNGFDGDATRKVTRSMTAHPIGDGKDSHRLRNTLLHAAYRKTKQTIFIGRACLSGVSAVTK